MPLWAWVGLAVAGLAVFLLALSHFAYSIGRLARRVAGPPVPPVTPSDVAAARAECLEARRRLRELEKRTRATRRAA